jgi:hypothetical protein
MDSMSFPSAKARLDYVRNKLATDAKWAIRALELVHEGQTAQEQTCERTTDLNGVGFTAFDAEILTSFAKQVIRHRQNPVYPSALSERQMVLLFKRIPKYAGQILSRSTKLRAALRVERT